jgi:hypothetical protein
MRFRVEDLGFRIKGVDFMVQSIGLWGLGVRVKDLWFRD